MRPTKIRNVDFKAQVGPDRRRARLKRLHWLALGLSAAAGLSLMLSGQQEADALLEAGTTASAATSEHPLPLPAADSEGALAEIPAEVPAPAREVGAQPPVVVALDTPRDQWQTVVVKSGDTLAGIFGRVGLSAGTMYSLLETGSAAKSLVRIFPGEEIRFSIDNGQLNALRYRIDESITLHVDLVDGAFQTALVATPLERRLSQAAGTIDSSLFVSAKQAGLSDGLTMQLANIFGWDIDFALDIRSGDTFAVVYEELYRHGDKIRDGGIVAAEFINQGRSFRAVAYTDADGNREYYSPDGHSMRKAFLRSPVDFRRISSKFNPARLHPVLGTKRPHRGVDYAAAAGTPIRAAGDGKIVHRGRKGGYGNTIVIQHGRRYSTLYGHMSRYASGLKSGSRVRQGQIIGYVGSTGLATGPHLHYEFLVDGTHRNPLTVSLPEAEPIGKRLMADFSKQTAPLIARLETISRHQVALQQQPQQ